LDEDNSEKCTTEPDDDLLLKLVDKLEQKLVSADYNQVNGPHLEEGEKNCPGRMRLSL